MNMRDGMPANSLSGSGNRTLSFNAAATQEVVVSAAGALAESETGGVHLNVVPREGGNSFSGTLRSTFGHKNLQGTNITDELRARNVRQPPDIRRLYDVSGGLGGPILRDKLWFYFSSRVFHTSALVPGVFYNKLQGQQVVHEGRTLPALFYAPDESRRRTRTTTTERPVSA